MKDKQLISYGFRFLFLLLVMAVPACIEFPSSEPRQTGPTTAKHADQALVKAIIDGERDRVDRMLAQKANPNARNKFGDTALIWAVHYRDEDLVERLLTLGADPNLHGTYGYGSLHWACKKSSVTLAKRLLESGAAVNLRDERGETPLFQAARANSPELVALLLKHGAKPNHMNDRAQNALLAAVRDKSARVVEPLVLAGADPTAADADGRSPLRAALLQDTAGWFLKSKILEKHPDLQSRLETLLEVRTLNETDQPRFDLTSLERRIHDLINWERQKHGLRPLAYDAELAEVARDHSKDMGEHIFFSHINLKRENPTKRAKRARYSLLTAGHGLGAGIGENIFQGFMHSGTQSYIEKGVKHVTYDWLSLDDIAHATVDGWMNSPGHRDNILHPGYRREGIGTVVTADLKIYITQNLW